MRTGGIQRRLLRKPSSSSWTISSNKQTSKLQEVGRLGTIHFYHPSLQEDGTDRKHLSYAFGNRDGSQYGNVSPSFSLHEFGNSEYAQISRQAVQAVEYWTKPSVGREPITIGQRLETMEHSFAMLRLLAQLHQRRQYDFDDNDDFPLSSDLLNDVLRNWNVHWKAICQSKHEDDSNSDNSERLLIMKQWNPVQVLSRMDHICDLSSHHILPDNKSYFFLMDGASHDFDRETNHDRQESTTDYQNLRRNDSISFIMMLLERIQTEFDLGRLGQPPHIVAYNILINAFSQRGDPLSAEQVLKDILLQQQQQLRQGEEPVLVPTSQTFNIVLSAWARSKHPQAPQRAQAILEKMHELYERFHFPIQPDIVSYTALLQCWSSWAQQQHMHYNGQRTKDEDRTEIAADRVDAIWAQICSSHNKNELQPNLVAYHTVMDAHAQWGNYQRVQQLLAEMDKDPNVVPTLYSHALVLKSFSKHNSSFTIEMAQQAQSFLQKMEDLADEDTSSATTLANDSHPSLMTKPSTINYNIVLNCWARCPGGGGKHAEKLLRRMVSQREKGLIQAKPNTISFHTVMSAWAESRSVKRVMKLFEEMMEGVDKSNHTKHEKKDDIFEDVQPNVRTWNIALKAWSRSQCEDAPERAQELLQRMKIMQNQEPPTSSLHIKPNILTYNSVLSCWANSNRPEAGEKAENTLNYIREQQEDAELQADSITYNLAIQAWSRSGNGKKAEELLLQMHREFCATKNPKIKPDVRTCGLVLAAWCRSKEDNAMERAEAILRRMQQVSANGGIDIEPDSYNYATILHGWVKAKQPERAQAILDEMEDRYRSTMTATTMSPKSHNTRRMVGRRGKLQKSLRPNPVLFNAVINLWSRLGHRDRAKALLERMKNLPA